MKKVVMIFLMSGLFFTNLYSRIERFKPCTGDDIEVWRITHDPTMRDWANYHNTEAWSPNGRYLCFTHYDPYETVPKPEIHLYDLYLDKDIKIDQGDSPRWANNHNWLFYLQKSTKVDTVVNVMWFDVDHNKRVKLTSGVNYLGETDYKDRWIYGVNRIKRGVGYGCRIPIREESTVERIDTVEGSFWIPNPEHPTIMIRKDHGDPVATDLPFQSTRTFCDLEGKNVTIGSPMLQRCHQSWSGDGTYLLHGGTAGTLMSGRFWNEPFPSNLHIITSLNCGDISPCGKSGRWLSGSSSGEALQVADLQSGDGYDYLKTALSFIHDSDKYGYSAGSGLADNDAKGSPDGTKIVFVSNYDLKNGPMTYISQDVSAGSEKGIPVLSTEGFPASGSLTIGFEIIGYKNKTATAFEGITRGLYGTTGTDLEYLSPTVLKEYEERNSDEEFMEKRGLDVLEKIRTYYSDKGLDLRKGALVTSFDARCIPSEDRDKFSPTSRFAQSDFPDKKNLNTPMPWQNRTDIYVAIVRSPDQPFLREIGDEVELIPGENSWEIAGYHIYKDGKKITGKPLRAGESLNLQNGRYTATAVEWSRRESNQSYPIVIKNPIKLRIIQDKPADFSWTYDRWLVEGKEVSPAKAKISQKSVREVVHRIEGTIHREWYNWGQIVQRNDLNADGKPIRCLFYTNGKLARREYHNRDGFHVSTEFFDADGYITEAIQYQVRNGVSDERSHFWFEKGMPVKHIGVGGRHASPMGKGIYIKEGEKWVKETSLE